MSRLAGYQVFSWLAIAFYTLGGTASRAAFITVGIGLVLTALGAAAATMHRPRRRPSHP